MQPTQDICAVLCEIRDLLRDLREINRISTFAYSTPVRTTTGTGSNYATIDTYRFPVAARFVTIVIWTNSVICQGANDKYAEWAMSELPLRGPAVYSIPMHAKSFRIRANDTAAQAQYGLLVTD